jgi:hypothetical protein
MRWCARVYQLYLLSCGRRENARGVDGFGREIFVIATCSLQFAKAGSAATLPQQEKNNSEDLQQG